MHTLPRLLALHICLALVFCISIADAKAQGESQYVGDSTCAGCHEKEHQTFTKHSRKAKSDKSVKLMAKKLTADELKDCFRCHTTGYGQPGGFVSFEKTPEMGHLGCESCHGPGSAHVDSGGAKNKIIGKGRMNIKQCEKCHNDPRVVNFRYKPRMYSGGH